LLFIVICPHPQNSSRGLQEDPAAALLTGAVRRMDLPPGHPLPVGTLSRFLRQLQSLFFWWGASFLTHTYRQGTDMLQVMNCAQQFLLMWSDFHNFIMADIITSSGPGLRTFTSSPLVISRFRVHPTTNSSFHISAEAYRTLRVFVEEYLTYVLDRRLTTLQLMRPLALPTYSPLPQPDQGLSSRYPADESLQRGVYVHPIRPLR
jgi:hypothetical protein